MLKQHSEVVGMTKETTSEVIGYDFDDYQKIHTLVLDYQAGVPGAAEQLVDAFSNFLWGFVNCIHYGIFSIKNYSLRKFISLYMDPNIQKRASQFQYKPSVREAILETAKRVQAMFSLSSEIELRQEMIVILLGMARKYKDYERPSFHNYVRQCFHYEAFRGLEHLISDMITRIPQEEYDDNLYNDTSSELEFDRAIVEMDHEAALSNSRIPTIRNQVSPFDLKSLNLNWTNGVTCGEAFSTLSIFERNILVMYYIEDLNDTEIAQKYGLCRATINRKRNAAETKLAKAVIPDNKKLL